MLEVRGVHAGYGAVPVLHGVNLKVEPGTIVALIGANGAGKSTTLKAISGLVAPTRGKIFWNGRNIARLSAPEIVRLGVVHVPESRQIFETQSVANNLRLGGYIHARRTPRDEWDRQQAQVLALFPDLQPRLNDQAGALSGGQQQMLAIARGLMTRPRLLLLDEPSLGLGPQIIEVIFAVIQNLKRQGIGVLLVEQNAALALQIADYGYVMESGAIALGGAGQQLLRNEEVARRYLGIGNAREEHANSQTRRELTENLRVVLQGL